MSGGRVNGLLWSCRVLACTLSGILWFDPAQATGTAAGVSIPSTAQVSYDLGGVARNASSNTATVIVAEIINITVTTLTSSVSVTPGATNQVLQFTLTNTGNSSEPFRLTPNSTVVGDDFDPVLASNSIYFDTDGTAGYSAGDTLYTAGSNDPTLAADASLTILVLNDIPSSLSDGAIGISQLTAASLTGTGSTGTVYSGKGTGGVDALLGTSGGTASGSGSYVAGAIALSMVKSQTIVDPYGGSEPMSGATITYQIVVTPSGSGTATGVVVSDAIPSNTTYVAGSLKLNSTTLTDSADTDAGSYLTSPSTQISVALSDLTASSSAQTVSFAVTIN